RFVTAVLRQALSRPLPNGSPVAEVALLVALKPVLECRTANTVRKRVPDRRPLRGSMAAHPSIELGDKPLLILCAGTLHQARHIIHRDPAGTRQPLQLAVPESVLQESIG